MFSTLYENTGLQALNPPHQAFSGPKAVTIVLQPVPGLQNPTGVRQNMPKRFAITIVAAALTLALAFLAPTSAQNLQRVSISPHPSRPSAADQQAPPASDEEIRERAVKVIANQHRDDDAIEQYERIERHVDRTSGSNPRILEDKTYRVVPTGLGTMKLLLKDGDKPSDSAEYSKQLQAWKENLEFVLRPDDYRTKAATAKWQKKKHDRAELVDAAHDAFTMKWIGRETFHGRLCDVLQLDPDPNFHPHSLFQDALTRVSVRIWIDRDTNQLARGEAHVIRDLSFGGGILGKLYRGGVFSLEQSEIAPGVWLPTRYQYDYTARKFLFTSEQHQYIEVSRYRLIGPPKQALVIAKSEIASGKSGTGDP